MDFRSFLFFIQFLLINIVAQETPRNSATNLPSHEKMRYTTNRDRGRFLPKTDQRREIPYAIDIQFSNEVRTIIMKAMDDFHEKTCIRFVPYQGQKRFIRITSEDTGCHISLNLIENSLVVNLQESNCVSIGEIVNKLRSAIEFFHEHSTVNDGKHHPTENVRSDAVNGTETTLSVDGKLILIQQEEKNLLMEQRTRLDQDTAGKINKLFSCSDSLLSRKKRHYIETTTKPNRETKNNIGTGLPWYPTNEYWQNSYAQGFNYWTPQFPGLFR